MLTWHRKQVERMMAGEEKRKDGGSSSLSSWAWHRGYSKTLLWSPQLPALFNFQSSFSSGTNSLETWVFVALDWSLYYQLHLLYVSRARVRLQGFFAMFEIRFLLMRWRRWFCCWYWRWPWCSWSWWRCWWSVADGDGAVYEDGKADACCCDATASDASTDAPLVSPGSNRWASQGMYCVNGSTVFLAVYYCNGQIVGSATVRCFVWITTFSSTFGTNVCTCCWKQAIVFMWFQLGLWSAIWYGCATQWTA